MRQLGTLNSDPKEEVVPFWQRFSAPGLPEESMNSDTSKLERLRSREKIEWLIR
jgi:hypothetical protein